jgi:hypothetical protein
MEVLAPLLSMDGVFLMMIRMQQKLLQEKTQKKCCWKNQREIN